MAQARPLTLSGSLDDILKVVSVKWQGYISHALQFTMPQSFHWTRAIGSGADHQGTLNLNGFVLG